MSRYKDGTYNNERQPVSRESGYQVGLWTRTTDADNVESVIDEILSEWGGEWGIWTNPLNGDIFVEPCVWYNNFSPAICAALLYNQVSIWCWATMDCIECEHYSDWVCNCYDLIQDREPSL